MVSIDDGWTWAVTDAEVADVGRKGNGNGAEIKTGGTNVIGEGRGRAVTGANGAKLGWKGDCVILMNDWSCMIVTNDRGCASMTNA